LAIKAKRGHLAELPFQYFKISSSLRCQEQVSFIVRPLFDVYEVCPGVQKNTEEVAVLFSVGSETAWSGDCGYRSHARHKLIIKENE
jgi:hypothetical protein